MKTTNINSTAESCCSAVVVCCCLTLRKGLLNWYMQLCLFMKNCKEQKNCRYDLKRYIQNRKKFYVIPPFTCFLALFVEYLLYRDYHLLLFRIYLIVFFKIPMFNLSGCWEKASFCWQTGYTVTALGWLW